MTPTRLSLPLLLILAAACASGGAGGDNGAAASRNVITGEQLAEIPDQTAYHAVRKLKPHWLQSRGQVSFGAQTHLLVVVDEGQFQELGYLHSVRAGDVREIRYMAPRRAMLKFGDRASGGAILVSIR